MSKGKSTVVCKTTSNYGVIGLHFPSQFIAKYCNLSHKHIFFHKHATYSFIGKSMIKQNICINFFRHCVIKAFLSSNTLFSFVKYYQCIFLFHCVCLFSLKHLSIRRNTNINYRNCPGGDNFFKIFLFITIHLSKIYLAVLAIHLRKLL